MEILCSIRKYSLPFEAYRAFRKRYARATDILCETFEIPENRCFQYVSENSERWQKFKFLSKCLFIMLYSLPSDTIRASERLKGLIRAKARLWDQKHLKTCPSLKVIHMRLLNEWRVNPKCFEQFH